MTEPDFERLMLSMRGSIGNMTDAHALRIRENRRLGREPNYIEAQWLVPGWGLSDDEFRAMMLTMRTGGQELGEAGVHEVCESRRVGRRPFDMDVV